jgi:hypothetical protein
LQKSFKKKFVNTSEFAKVLDKSFDNSIEKGVFEGRKTMIEKINNEQLPRLTEKAGPQNPPASKARASNEPDATLQADFTSLIESAAGGPPDESAAVEKALKLLKSGQLETSENIRQAAENIAKLGI